MHPFSPPPPVLQSRQGIWLGMLIVAFVFFALAALLLRPKRKPRYFDVLIWIAAGIVLIVLFSSTTSPARGIRGARDSLFLMAWLMVIWGSVLNLSRLRSKDEPFGSPGSIIVSLGVFVFLLVLSMPARSYSGEASRQQCKENLREIALAFYQDEFDTFPHQVTGEPSASWRVNLLPYLEHDDIHQGYDFAVEWDAPANLPVARQLVPEYSCPSVPEESRHRDGLRFTSYVLAVGEDTIWPAAGPLAYDDINDGGSHTLLVIEACGQHIVWTEPRDMEFGTTPTGINLPGERPDTSDGISSSYHPGGAFATFADGSVRLLSEETDPDVLDALLTADGGEAVRDF